MPQIIYGDAGNASVANSLKSLGDSMFGNQSQRELIRQNALAKQRVNANIQPFAEAARSGDSNSLAYYGALADKSAVDASGYNLLSRSNHASGVDDPRLATAQLGAGERIASTAVGQGRELAQRAAAASEATNRAAQTQQAIAERQIQQQQWTDEHTLVNLRGPDGKITMVPKSQTANLQAHGYDVMPSLDQTKANLLTGAPGASGGGTTSLSPDQRSIVGLPATPASYQHPQTGETGVSQDNGQTITLPNGRRVIVSGSGFMPVSHESALGQERDNNVRNATSTPLNVPADMSATPAANEARATTGIVPALANEANKHLGALPGATTVLKGLTGSPEIAPQQQQAEQNQNIRNQQTRAALAASGGRQSVQAQKWVNENLPDGPVFGNPETEARRVSTVISAIKMDYEADQRAAQDPNTPPVERQKLLQHMHELQRVAGLWTGKAQGAGTAQPNATGPATAGAVPTATNPQTGEKLYLRNGQWGPQ